jgi:hypothetical protein
VTLLSLWQAASPFLSVAGAILLPASAFVATTKTPAPGSFWSTVYKGIEIAALVVGKAKDTGLPAAIASGNAGAIVTAGVATVEQVVAAAGAPASPAAAQATASTPFGAGTRGPQFGAGTRGPQ